MMTAVSNILECNRPEEKMSGKFYGTILANIHCNFKALHKY